MAATPASGHALLAQTQAVPAALPEGLPPRIRYTVTITSKTYGNVNATRIIRSGQADDYTWRSPAPASASAKSTKGCPSVVDLPVDAIGAPVRVIQFRIAPIVDAKGVANVQANFAGRAPQTVGVTVNGESVACPKVVALSQLMRFSVRTNGRPTKLTLTDGTQLLISAVPDKD
jgi:hypothetical protein